MALNDLDDVVRVLESIEGIQQRAHGYGFSDGPVVEQLKDISSKLERTNSVLDDIRSVLISIEVHREP